MMTGSQTAKSNHLFCTAPSQIELEPGFGNEPNYESFSKPNANLEILRESEAELLVQKRNPYAIQNYKISPYYF